MNTNAVDDLLYDVYLALMQHREKIGREIPFRNYQKALEMAADLGKESWAVQEITPEALRVVAGMAEAPLERAHLMARRDRAAELLSKKYNKDEFINFYRNNDRTTLATRDENRTGNWSSPVTRVPTGLFVGDGSIKPGAGEKRWAHQELQKNRG